jgi:hypothetical protein
MLLGFMGFHDTALSDEKIINESLMSSERCRLQQGNTKLRKGFTDDHGY